MNGIQCYENAILQIWYFEIEKNFDRCPVDKL